MAIAKLKVAQAALVLLTIFTSVYPFNSTQLSVQERQEWEQFIKRFNEPRSVRLLSNELWSEIHGGGNVYIVRRTPSLNITSYTSSRVALEIPFKE